MRGEFQKKSGRGVCSRTHAATSISFRHSKFQRKRRENSKENFGENSKEKLACESCNRWLGRQSKVASSARQKEVFETTPQAKL